MIDIVPIACHDKLPIDYLSKCSWTCEEWAGRNEKGINFCEDKWSTKRICVPYSKGQIKDDCRSSCSNCGNVYISRKYIYIYIYILNFSNYKI